MSILAMKSDQILRITAAEKLFSSAAAFEDEFKSLAKKWHPDKNNEPTAAAVFAHLNKLRQEAKWIADRGTWPTPGTLFLNHVSGGKSIFHYKRHLPIEGGDVYYGRKQILYSINADYADLVHAGTKVISGFRYRDAAMQKEVSRYLPLIQREGETTDRRCFILMSKTDDVFALTDVKAALGGKVEPKHVAWILNAVYNIACYLEFAGLTHNAITIDNVFISPTYHSALLLGGWWYAVQDGGRLNALPHATHSIVAPDMLRSKRANARLDLASIRLLGRTLLGDATGMTLQSLGVPAPMATFLRHPPGSSARTDYAAWHAAVKASFGPRRFVELAVSENDIFNL